MAKPTFTFENYAPAGNTLYDLYRYYLDPSAYDDDEEEVLNPGLAPFFGIGSQTIGGQGQDDTSNIWNYAAQQVVEEARREHLLRNLLVPTSIGAMTAPDAGWQVAEDAIIAQQMKDAWSEGHDDARRAAQEKAASDRVAQQIASSSQGISSAGNQARPPQMGGGGAGVAAAGMGGGSRQATSAGATSSGRTDRGWGWAKGGLIRKKYDGGGIIGLL